MAINTSSRSQLKSYFVTNAVPTDRQYSDLIDGALNQKDDGITKTPGNPLGIKPGEGTTGGSKVLELYETFADVSEWTLSIRRQVDENNVTQRRGLAIGGVDGMKRLFIDRETGNVGVGTIEPAARLHVAGDLQVDGALKMGDGAFAIPSGQPVTGIQVVDFAILEYVLPDCNDVAHGQSKTFTFSQPVISARALVRSFMVDFNPLVACEFYSNGLRTSCTTNGRDVTVDLTLTLTGKVPLALNRAGSHGTASVLVIAVLKNAV
jgi:hypothetical protein